MQLKLPSFARQGFATTRSGIPSPLKSAVATEFGSGTGGVCGPSTMQGFSLKIISVALRNCREQAVTCFDGRLMSAVAIFRQSTGAYSLTTTPKIVLTNWTWLRPCCFMRASLVLVTPRHKLESGAGSASCAHAQGPTQEGLQAALVSAPGGESRRRRTKRCRCSKRQSR
jgi:hypothetical protein